MHVATCSLPTCWGTFQAHVFRSIANDSSGEAGEKDHVALAYGHLEHARNVPVRVHSECLTSEVFGSLKCDCRAQLDEALARIARRGRGALLYLRQEGRGIGLANKVRAYALQATAGADTVDANRLLGLPDDARRYDVVREMLAFLEVRSVELMTNNPAKVQALRDLGIEVTRRLPLVVPVNPLSAAYVDTKRRRMGHQLDVAAPTPTALASLATRL